MEYLLHHRAEYPLVLGNLFSGFVTVKYNPSYLRHSARFRRITVNFKQPDIFNIAVFFTVPKRK